MKGPVAQFEQAMAWLAGHERLLLISHRRPDGDAIGALVGMARLLEGNGKHACVALYEPCPTRYANLLEDVASSLWTDVEADIGSRFDGIVVVDTCSWNQLEPVADVLRPEPADMMIVDHHATFDEIGQVRVIDSSASSACLLVAELAQSAGWSLNESIATCLFIGMATDTGWFRFSSVDERTLAMAGRLVACGAKPDDVYESLYLGEPPERIRLLAELLSSLELYEENRLAAVTLPRGAFERSGATPAMTEDLINEPQRIGSVTVAILFVEHESGEIRVSFRSKGATNVAKLAQQFGGGGHAQAAGARIQGQLDDVKEQVLRETRRAMAACNS